MDSQDNHIALPLRAHTILGVCEAIGEDFGFNPVVPAHPACGDGRGQPDVGIRRLISRWERRCWRRVSLFPKRAVEQSVSVTANQPTSDRIAKAA